MNAGFKIIKLKYIFILLIALAVLISLNGCCGILNNMEIVESTGSQLEYDTEAVSTGTILPPADDIDENFLKPGNFLINIYQKTSAGPVFEKDNPVYFSALLNTAETVQDFSLGSNGDILDYIWTIGKDTVIYGDRISYIFSEAGEYEVSLTVSAKNDSISQNTSINIADLKRPAVSLKEYKCSVTVEYILENTGSENVKNITAFIETPQTYKPYQEILKVYSNNYNFEKLFDDEWNLVSKFELGNLGIGEKISAEITSDIVISEFSFDRKNREISGPDAIAISPEDVSFYTSDEPFFEINDPLIKNIVKNITGTADNPLIAAERLYNFVIEELEYDYEKLESGNLDYLAATDILALKKGVCLDYSILYASLCRAAKIPAKIAIGIPVLGILQEETKELAYGHAWVEIWLPDYGWVPVDITHERMFMADNYALNLKSYEGVSRANLKSGGNNGNYFPIGFNYYWEGTKKPELKQKVLYRVNGLDIRDINMILEGEFLNDLYYILSEYQAAINHVKIAHGDKWIFNDPKDIAIEKSLLSRMQEILITFEQLYYPQSYEKERNNILAILGEINVFKRLQIESMENGNFDQYVINYNSFISSLNSLFDAYNFMSSSYNKKYN